MTTPQLAQQVDYQPSPTQVEAIADAAYRQAPRHVGEPCSTIFSAAAEMARRGLSDEEIEEAVIEGSLEFYQGSERKARKNIQTYLLPKVREYVRVGAYGRPADIRRMAAYQRKQAEVTELKILTALTEDETPRAVERELRQEGFVGKNRSRRWLLRLRDRGYVTRVRQGHYRLTELGWRRLKVLQVSVKIEGQSRRSVGRGSFVPHLYQGQISTYRLPDSRSSDQKQRPGSFASERRSVRPWGFYVEGGLRDGGGRRRRRGFFDA